MPNNNSVSLAAAVNNATPGRFDKATQAALSFFPDATPPDTTSVPRVEPAPVPEGGVGRVDDEDLAAMSLPRRIGTNLKDMAVNEPFKTALGAVSGGATLKGLYDIGTRIAAKLATRYGAGAVADAVAPEVALPVEAISLAAPTIEDAVAPGVQRIGQHFVDWLADAESDAVAQLRHRVANMGGPAVSEEWAARLRRAHDITQYVTEQSAKVLGYGTGPDAALTNRVVGYYRAAKAAMDDLMPVAAHEAAPAAEAAAVKEGGRRGIGKAIEKIGEKSEKVEPAATRLAEISEMVNRLLSVSRK